jgi:hypothetical protein
MSVGGKALVLFIEGGAEWHDYQNSYLTKKKRKSE